MYNTLFYYAINFNRRLYEYYLKYMFIVVEMLIYF